ncbi:MAG: hypothetical protein FJ100_22550 [Deltaproteobacteria bacterium]|nr:hypothetical protein [Deltaproteobacteria bacterium]
MCNKATGHCTDCLADGDCELGQKCYQGACSKTCTSSKSCPPNVCALDLGVCVVCVDSLDCAKGFVCGKDHACHATVCSQHVCQDGVHFACKPDGSGYTATTCDDGNPCTTDGCDPVKGCNAPNKPDGADCDDGLPCAGDTCKNGKCQPVPMALDVTFGGDDARGVHCAVASDGGDIVGYGMGQVAGNPNVPWAFRVGPAGKVVWSKPGYIATGQYPLSSRCVSDGVGGLYGVGWYNKQPQNVQQGFVLHLGADGTSQVVQTGGDVFRGIARSAAGDLLALTLNGELTAFDATLQVKQAKKLIQFGPTAWSWTDATAIAAGADGTVWVAGTAFNKSNNENNDFVGKLAEPWPTVPVVTVLGIGHPISELVVRGDGSVLAVRHYSEPGSLPGGSVSIGRITASGSFNLGVPHPAVPWGAHIALTQAGKPLLFGSFNGNLAPGVQGGSDAFVRWLDPADLTAKGGLDFAGSGYEELYSAIAAGDGSVTLVGATNSKSTTPAPWLVHPDAAGNVACPCTGGGGTKPCDDGNPCTLDTCDKVAGCKIVPAANGTPCADGNPFTVDSVCSSSKCGGGCAQAAVVSPPEKAKFHSTVRYAKDKGVLVAQASSGPGAAYLSVIDAGKQVAVLNYDYDAFRWAVRADGAIVGGSLSAPLNSYSQSFSSNQYSFGIEYSDGGVVARAWAGGDFVLGVVNRPPGKPSVGVRRAKPGGSPVDEWTEPEPKSANAWQQVSVYPGHADGHVLVCWQSEVAGKDVPTVRFRRRAITNDPTAPVWTNTATYSPGGGQSVGCAPYRGTKGAMVLSYPAGGGYTDTFLDDAGQVVWQIPSYGEFYLEAPGKMLRAVAGTNGAPVTVETLDASGKVVASTALGSMPPFGISASVTDAVVAGGKVVLVGTSLYFKLDPKAVGGTVWRADLDLATLKPACVP